MVKVNVRVAGGALEYQIVLTTTERPMCMSVTEYVLLKTVKTIQSKDAGDIFFLFPWIAAKLKINKTLAEEKL